MPDQELIDGLVATYRTLNLNVRSLPEQRLQQSSADGSVRDVVRRLRDDELRFSQALKERITGVAMPQIFATEAPVLGTEDPNDTTAILVAQFGTARESTLAMLRSLPDPEWDRAENSGTPIRASIRDLVANDRQQLDRIANLLAPR